jgi:glycopeptide antibiotics resistance protein
MIEIYYWPVFWVFTALWVLARVGISICRGRVSWKREFQMLLVYICIVVVVRFTFFPFFKVEGKIQPLLFDPAKIFPPRINLLPIVYLFDYPVFREALINFLGNSLMFLPLGIVWPVAFQKLDTHWKVIAAGAGTSLLIEILQLPFFDRVSDIDDLILNTAGFLAGYGIFLLVKAIIRLCKRK